jgi:hypothetical protein
MNDITQLSTLYSNAIARAEKAEEALRVERERCAVMAENFAQECEDDGRFTVCTYFLRFAADVRTPPPVRETP